ncbi:septum site-determining protein MinC [Bacillus marinisedimentorum]|uniref:septum site-determining protein MinC n=1 Tax=Bacillus marinisedimentorum TaxID=1821260 RepID=UPI0008725C38|nr:septum site-determining protein MinC [Bacillus marinisedimentorum]
MGHNQQYVAIKGTKKGLTLYIDDKCSFDELLKELDHKLSSNHHQDEERPLVIVRLEVGNRYLTKEQEEQIRELIRTKKNLVVEEINSSVMTKKEAREWKESQEVLSAAKIVRSGQVLEVKGDLLLIGDVNPGGTVKAAGNIFVLGALKGIAHAGCNGNEDAVVAASIMKPSQLRIADVISRSPDSKNEEDQLDMECAYIDENHQILIERLQYLTHIRPQLNRLK